MWRPRSRSRTSTWSRCSPGTGTSRPGASAGAGRLPRVARSASRTRSPVASTSTSRPIHSGKARRAGVPAGCLAEPRRGPRRDGRRDHRGSVHDPVRAHLGRRCALARAAHADRSGVRVGPGLDLRPGSALLRRSRRRAPVRGHRGARVLVKVGTPSRPTTSRRRARSRPTRPPAPTCASAASSPSTSTRMAPDGATTR